MLSVKADLYVAIYVALLQSLANTRDQYSHHITLAHIANNHTHFLPPLDSHLL